MKKLILLIIIVTVSISYSAYNVIEFSVSCKGNQTRIKIFTDDIPEVQDTVLTGPDRLAVDFVGGINQLTSNKFDRLPPGLVMSVRASQHADNKTRVVFDLAEAPVRHNIEVNPDGLSIIVPTPDYPEIDGFKSGRKANIPKAPKDEKPKEEPKEEPKAETKKEEPAKPKEEVKPKETPSKEDTAKQTKTEEPKKTEPAKEQPKAQDNKEQPKTNESKADSKVPSFKDKQDDSSEKEEIEEFVIPQGIAGEIVVDTTKKAYYKRTKIVYNKIKDRDPFLPIADKEVSALGEQNRPSIENLKLVGIMGDPGEFSALLQDTKGFGYIFTIGDSVTNGNVIAIDDTSLTFRIDEYGYIRNVNISFTEGEEK